MTMSEKKETSQLNESQRQRAEQNRLRALQIRQQKMAARGCTGAQITSGALQSTLQGPVSTTRPTHTSFPPPLKSTSEPPVKTSEVPQSSVVPLKFYTPSPSSGVKTSTSGDIKTTPGHQQSTFKTSQPGGTSQPPAKHPRLEPPNKPTSTLPPEVLKRIEENKRKAQERQEALRKAREQGHSVPQVPTVLEVVSAPRPNPQPTSKPVIPNASEKNNSATKPGVSRSSKGVTVTFMLTSISTFSAATSMYHAATIQVFKTMTSKNYDFNTRVWNFNINEHKKLLEALRPLQPDVEVQPLPLFVVAAVKAAAKKVPAEFMDLFGLDSRLQDALMPFQAEGVKFGISLGGRVLLADDMGLGKTIQSLGIACYYRSEWPLLVVTPSSMRYSWEESIVRWVSSVSGQDIKVMTTANDHFQEAEVVVVSYDLLSRKADKFLQHNFGVVIFDESHMLKNYKSARCKTAVPLMKKVKRVILLSGTPALSRPMEMYTQIRGVDPSLFPQVQDYGVRYCDGRKEAWGWSFRGSSNTEELQIILRACVWIRRLKSEVLSQLPSKQRMTVVLDPEMIKSSKKSQQDMARNFSLHGLSSFQEGDQLQFFMKTAEAKIAAVREYLKEVIESGKKFLVFAHHKVMIENLCSLCEETKARYIRIDGRTSAEDRMTNTTKFQNQDDVQVAVLSITAANTGITLTAAQLVIFAELYWNPGALVQAEDRAHRIGQQDSVVVQYLVARKTADDHIWPLVERKLEVLGKVGLSNEKLSDSKTSYQKSVAEPDIRNFMPSGNTRKETSPRKSAASPDIRSFLQPHHMTENTDLHWNP